MKSASTKVIVAAFIGNLLIALTKFIAAIWTGSSAMFSEAIHSVVDTGNQILLMYGIHRSRKPPDEHFPFGYGKEIYFWSFVVSIFIFSIGAGFSIYEGIHHVITPAPARSPLVNYIVIGFAFIFEGGSLFVAVREFTRIKGRKGIIAAIHQEKDPTIFAVLFEDSAALAGLIIALAGVFLTHITGIELFDAVASIIIGVILAGIALWLAYETKSLLIGESAVHPVVQKIREIVQQYSVVEFVNEVLTTHFGPDFILVNLSVDFRDSASAGEIEKVVARIDEEIKQQIPRVKRVFIEGESRRAIYALRKDPESDRNNA